MPARVNPSRSLGLVKLFVKEPASELPAESRTDVANPSSRFFIVPEPASTHSRGSWLMTRPRHRWPDKTPDGSRCVRCWLRFETRLPHRGCRGFSKVRRRGISLRLSSKRLFPSCHRPNASFAWARHWARPDPTFEVADFSASTGRSGVVRIRTAPSRKRTSCLAGRAPEPPHLHVRGPRRSRAITQLGRREGRSWKPVDRGVSFGISHASGVLQCPFTFLKGTGWTQHQPIRNDARLATRLPFALEEPPASPSWPCAPSAWASAPTPRSSP